jgi:hypothetical protein
MREEIKEVLQKKKKISFHSQKAKKYNIKKRNSIDIYKATITILLLLYLYTYTALLNVHTTHEKRFLFFSLKKRMFSDCLLL